MKIALVIIGLVFANFAVAADPGYKRIGTLRDYVTLPHGSTLEYNEFKVPAYDGIRFYLILNVPEITKAKIKNGIYEEVIDVRSTKIFTDNRTIRIECQEHPTVASADCVIETIGTRQVHVGNNWITNWIKVEGQGASLLYNALHVKQQDWISSTSHYYGRFQSTPSQVEFELWYARF